jgi:U4/U6 small nuclear ribonucleoprotein PRP3
VRGAHAQVNKPATTATLNPYLAHAAVESEPAGARAARGRRGLHFLERGELSARAQQMRAQAAVDAVFAQPGASSAAAMPPSAVGAAGDGAGGDAAAAGGFGGGGVQLPASYLAAARAVVGASQLAPVPRVEWWDALLLKRGPLPAGSEQAGALAPQYDLGTDEAKVTAYVEHPVPLEPPAELAPPPAQPLPLTAKERKKLRTQRRQAQERAKQDQIRAGLAEPPPPKVKLSNIMRALGEQAVANPTEVEARVRAQVAEREAAHERRNADSKLSKEQRREKRLHKVAADLGAGVHVVVYKASAGAGAGGGKGASYVVSDVAPSPPSLAVLCPSLPPRGPIARVRAGERDPDAPAAAQD